MIRRLVVSVLITAGTLAPATPAAASASASEDTGYLLGMSMVLGGTYGGVSYDGLWGGRGPNGSTTYLYVPASRTSLEATAYFGNAPEAYTPDGEPVPGKLTMAYQWHALTCSRSPYIRPLGPLQRDEVEIDEAAHVTSVVPPSKAVSATLPLDPACTQYGIRFYQTSRYSNFVGAMGIWITRTPPADLPIFDAARDSQGRVVLYAVGTTGELEHVQISGTLPARAEGALRYFFTNCAAARSFRAAMFQAGRDAAGVIRIPTDADIVGRMVGVTAKKNGASDLKAWGVEEATGFAWDQAKTVVKGDNPVEGCLP